MGKVYIPKHLIYDIYTALQTKLKKCNLFGRLASYSSNVY